jgi:hypothetical protein
VKFSGMPTGLATSSAAPFFDTLRIVQRIVQSMALPGLMRVDQKAPPLWTGQSGVGDRILAKAFFLVHPGRQRDGKLSVHNSSLSVRRWAACRVVAEPF